MMAIDRYMVYTRKEHRFYDVLTRNSKVLSLSKCPPKFTNFFKKYIYFIFYNRLM